MRINQLFHKRSENIMVDYEEKSKKDIFMGLLSIVIVCIVVMPIVIASFYSFYQTDDFKHAMNVGVFGSNIFELLIASFKYSKQMYLVWQGTYTAMFLQSFLSPLNGLGSVQLRIVMMINVLLFIFSLALFVIAVCKRLNLKKSISFSILAICSIGVFGYKGWIEVFYWFSGAVSYSIPLSLSFIGIAFSLKAKDTKGYIAASILMFLASGGSLEVAGTGCFILLGICTIKKILGILGYKDFVVFGFAVAGAMINAVAPGNYVRHSAIDNTGLHLGTAVMASVYELMDTVEDLFINTPFILLVIAALYIGVYIKKSGVIADIKVIYTIILFGVITPFVTCFPVCFAYSGGDYFPNRCQFVEIVVLVLVIMTISISLGYIFAEHFNEFQVKEIISLFVVFFIVMPNLNSSWKLSETVPYQMWKEIMHDSYKNYYKEVKDIYDFVVSDKNEDVFISDIPMEGVAYFPEIMLSEDMSDWTNTSIAAYFGKNSVQYVSDNVCKQANGQKNIRISPEMFDIDLSFVSIFKISNSSQQTEVLQVLEPITSNIIISTQEEESGKIGIYIFADKEGTAQIGQMEIDY